MQIFPTDATAAPGRSLRRSDFWETARRAPRPHRLRGFGTPLFLLTIAGTIAGAGVAALRYGDPDRWDPRAPNEALAAHNATMTADIAPATAPMPEGLAAPPACIPVVMPAASVAPAAPVASTSVAAPHVAKKSAPGGRTKKRVAAGTSHGEPSPAEVTPADLPAAN